ncbi:MAG: ACP phosphodiesterase [Bacteroidota bacterium]
MNFLAHLVLSCQDPQLQLGNFLGDYTKGRPPAHYPDQVKQGILLHRLIDVTTDQHPIVKKMATRLKPRHGRYAGVVTDVIYDLYLYRNWGHFNLLPFDEFCELTYQNLTKDLSFLANKLAQRVEEMVSERWLDTYTSEAGILAVFARMRSRFSQPEWLDGVELTMREEDDAFNQSFLQLFPDLQQTVNTFCGCD